MKLRRIVSTILAIALVVTAVPIGQIARAEDTTAPTTVNAVDSNYVLGNNTKLSDGALTGSNMGDLRWDRPSLYSDPSGLYKQNDASKNGSLGVEESTYRWPYAALKVSVEQTGTYDVSLVVNSNTGAKYNTFGMMVDGIMHVLSYDKSKAKATVNTQVSLTKGTHILVFTTAMPADPVVAKGLATGDSAAYPWFNFHTFTLGAGLKVLSAPTKQEVINSACTRIEAENTAYVSYVGYESAKTETPTGASSKTVGGVSRGSELKQSFAQLSEYLDKAGMAYVQYAVEAPEDGIYNIRVGYLAGGSGEKPFVTVLVNDTVYKANFDNNWGSLDAPTLAVEMKKGINLIRCTSLTTDQACFSSSWINQDYLDVDSKLTVLDATSWNTINAGDETKVLANQYTDQGDTLESAVTSALRGDCPSLETLHLTGDNLITWPFAAIRVTADDDGYYDFTVNIGPNASSTSKQIAMLVDGEVVCKPFTVAASASVDGSVFLTQGTHILVFTTPMPKTAAEASALTSQTVGNAYPWCNYQSFVIDSRLQVETAPVLDDIREFLGQTIQAVATTKVIYANYKKHNDNNSGIIASPNGDYLKNNRVSLETLLDAGWERAPYTAFEVTVEEDGKYDIYALISTDGGTTSSQLGMIIDGETVKTVAIKKASGKQIVGDSVYLEKGIHLIAFTTPMPLDDAEALAIPEPDTDSWAGMNKAYPWCDVYEFDLGNELVVSDNFTTDKITVSTGDTTKVDKNWCTYKDSDDEDDIADFLGANTDDYKYHRVSLETLSEYGLFYVPYASIQVTAEADGYYDIYASILTKSDISSKYAALIVDGKTVYPVTITGSGKTQEIGALIPLKKGTHTIAITSAMPETDAEAQAITNPSEDSWTAMNKAYPWFDFYSFSVSGRLEVVSVSENPLKDNSVLFVGDSITNSADSWASKIGTWNHMDWTNASIKGATIATVKGNHIIHQMKANAVNNYDYVIMHGGINDAMAKVEIGKVSDSYNVADFDNKTYIGALETMFYYAYENFEDAKLGYIINYATPNSNWGGYTQDMKAYVEEARRACVKWNISYIDLYEGTVLVNGEELSYSYDILEVDTNAKNFLNKDAHEIHLSDDGYKVISPYIEAWMETIPENSNPLLEENRQKYIDAGNADKVLSDGFTISEGTLVDRDYSGMVEDEANIERLPYAKDMLGDWAYASIRVNAQQAGEYKIMVEMSAKTQTLMGMLVDGEAYTLEYSKQDGFCQFMEQTVYLTAGTHYITFTSAMPKDIVGVVGDAWNIYPWTNIYTIVVGAGLEIMSKPELSDVTAQLGTISDIEQTVINAGDTNGVLSNYFENNGSSLGNMDASDLRWDKLTLDKLSVDNLHYMPYTALKVTADADGTYDIILDIETNPKAVSDQLGLMVDGKDVHVVKFLLASKTKAKATVYLEKGSHTLVFTSPMPETEAEFEDYITAYNADKEEKDKLKTGDGATHPWINFISYTLSKGLQIEKVPTVNEIESPSFKRIEAEDNKYVIYNGYTSEAEKAEKASGGKVIGGVKRWMIEQTFEELKTWIDASDSHMAYVEYAIEAPEDGEYEIRVGYLAEVNKKVENRNEIEKPFVAVLVNKDVYKAQFGGDWGEIDAVALKVKLNKGINIIRATTYTSDQEIRTVSSWINQDYLDIDGRLVAIERSSTVVEAEDSKFYNLLTPQTGGEKENASNSKVMGSAQLIRAKSLGITLENFTMEQIRMVPYFSYTVEAPMDGYYSISMNFCGDGRMPKSQIGVIVDEKINTLKYNRCGTSSDKNKAVTTVYLTKGEHNLTFTTPLPLNAEELASFNWSYGWMNFDYLTFHDGLKLAKEQKSPTTIAEPVRIEAENVGLPNLTKVNAATEGKDAKEGYIGGARYRRSQSVAEIKANGIDGKSTPYVQYTINAKETGTYTVYFSASYGIYQPTVEQMDATVAIEVNNKVSFHTVSCDKTTKSGLIPVTMNLSAGNNIVRLTHLTSDSICGEGYCWIDYNYIEVSASDNEKIKFIPTNGVVEAERQEVVTYTTNSSAGSSGGQCLGNGDYNYIDEKDITFANLDVKNLGELSRVTYTVVTEQAGKYNLAIQFNGGVINYTYKELVEMGSVGFAISVNEGEKQLVEFCPDASTGSFTRIVEVDLKAGENKIMVTTTLADYISGVSPRIEDEYRLYWMDHDALYLTAGVSDANQEVKPYDIEDTDINHAMVAVKTPTANNDADSSDKDTGANPMVIVIISTVAVVGVASAAGFVFFKKKLFIKRKLK